MKLGTAKATITPPVGTQLAGFAFRDQGSESILDDLEVRALWFEADGGLPDAVCIVTADVIGIDATLTKALRDAIHGAHNIAPERVLLCASHTHSGPQTCSNMLGVGVLVPEVVEMVRQRVFDAVVQARHNLRPVTLHAGRGRCEGYAINRRLVRDGKAMSAPNLNGVRDDEVGVIMCFDTQDAGVRAVLFHFTCHPTTMGDYRITADYPGAARRHIEQALGNTALAAFLPGCFGDVRPNCTYIGGQRFRRGQPEDVAAFGNALGEAVLGVVRSNGMRQLTPTLNGRITTIELPLARHPDADELARTLDTGTAIEKEWASNLLSRPISHTRPLTLQRINLAQEATLIAMGGEICCDYGHFIKTMALERDSFVLPLGYSNGMIGYIPSARMFAEGGYEVVDSTLYFGLPAAFDPSIEGLIRDRISALIRR